MADNEIQDLRARLQKGMIFLGALAEGAEKLQKDASLAVGYLAGKKVGTDSIEGVEQTDDPVKAVGLLREALLKQGVDWNFEIFKPEGQPAPIKEEEGKKVIYLVFRDCIIRNVLYHYGYAQKKSLCTMSHGVFAGALEKIIPDKTINLEIEHSGENACYKVLTIAPKQSK